MKKILFSIFSFAAFYSTGQAVTENFDNFAASITAGWSVNNLSNPLGTDNWAQGDAAGFGAPAFNGLANAYAQVGFAATTDTGSGTISAWLISPQLPLFNGIEVSFYALSFNSSAFPDRLECRLNPTGTADVGTDENSVGGFTTLLVSVNPNLTMTGFPSIQTNGVWTKYTATISGLSAPISGRLGFRYFVTDGGGDGSNSSTIGLDAVRVGSSTVSVTELTSSIQMYPNPTTGDLFITSKEAVSIVIYDLTGKTVKEATNSNGSATIDVSNLENGTYIIKDLISGGTSKFVKN